MPYKDIEKRREVEKISKAKARSTKTGIQKDWARRVALHTFPIAQMCSIKECFAEGERHHPNYEEPLNILWLCKTHHEQIHHPAKCVIEGCDGKHRAKGFCNKHWKAKKVNSEAGRLHRNEVMRKWRKDK